MSKQTKMNELQKIGWWIVKTEHKPTRWHHKDDALEYAEWLGSEGIASEVCRVSTEEIQTYFRRSYGWDFTVQEIEEHIKTTI